MKQNEMTCRACIYGKAQPAHKVSCRRTPNFLEKLQDAWCGEGKWLDELNSCLSWEEGVRREE